MASFRLSDFLQGAASTAQGMLQGQIAGQQHRQQQDLLRQQQEQQRLQQGLQILQTQRELSPFPTLLSNLQQFAPESRADIIQGAVGQGQGLQAQFAGMLTPQQRAQYGIQSPTAPATAPGTPPPPLFTGAAAQMGVGPIQMPAFGGAPMAPPAMGSQVAGEEALRSQPVPAPMAPPSGPPTAPPVATGAPAAPEPAGRTVTVPGVARPLRLGGVSKEQSTALGRERTSAIRFLEKYSPADAYTQERMRNNLARLSVLDLTDEPQYREAQQILSEVNRARQGTGDPEISRQSTNIRTELKRLLEPNVSPARFGRGIINLRGAEVALQGKAGEDRAFVPDELVDFAPQIDEMKAAYDRGDREAGDALARDIQAALGEGQSPADQLRETRLGIQILGGLAPEVLRDKEAVARELETAGLNSFAARVRKQGVQFGSANAQKELRRLMGMVGTFATQPLESRKFFVDQLIGAARATGKKLELTAADIQKFDPAQRLRIAKLHKEVAAFDERIDRERRRDKRAEAEFRRDEELHKERMKRFRGFTDPQTADGLFKFYQGAKADRLAMERSLKATRADIGSGILEPEEEAMLQEAYSAEEQAKQGWEKYFQQKTGQPQRKGAAAQAAAQAAPGKKTRAQWFKEMKDANPKLSDAAINAALDGAKIR